MFYRNFVKSDASKAFMKKLAPIYLPGRISDVVSDVAYMVSDLADKEIGKFHIEHLRPGIASLEQMTE